MKNLFNIVDSLIKGGKEGDYWDFKQKYHENNLDLVHDIICLANNIRHKGDRYLIFGVDDKANVIGVEHERRRKQYEILDILSKINFANGAYPDIKVEELDYDDRKLDILIIEDRSYKPYFLTQDYVKKTTSLRAGTIYARIQDRNTAKNSCAPYTDIKAMWQEQLGLSQTPRDRVMIYLNDDIEAWGIKGDVYFHKKFPEFTISIAQEDPFDNYSVDEEWLRGEIGNFYTQNINTRHKYCIKYGTTIIDIVYIVGFDNHKKSIVQPDWHPYDAGRIYYYIKDSMKYKFQQFWSKSIKRDDSIELYSTLSKKGTFCLPVFQDEDELNTFLKFTNQYSKDLCPESNSDKQNKIFFRALNKFEEFKNFKL